MNILEMLATAHNQSEDDGSDLPLEEAQREELTAILADISHVHKFQMGDFVRFKRRCGPLNKRGRKLAVVYWRPLDLESDWDRKRIKDATEAECANLSLPDCLLALLPSGAADLSFILGETALLEPDAP